MCSFRFPGKIRIHSPAAKCIEIGLRRMQSAPATILLGLSPWGTQRRAFLRIQRMLELSTPVQYVKGVGPRIAEVLAAKGIHTVGDLLHYLPFRYEDRINPRGISELRPGEMATVIAEGRNSGLFRPRRMPIFQLTVGQGRTRLKCLWFHGAYLQDKFKPGQMIALSGKVKQARGGELQIIHPQFEILGDPGEEGRNGAEKEQHNLWK